VRLYDLDHTDPTTAGNDLIAAGTGASFIFGQGGDDWISGGAGDDYAEGNAGNDVVTGDRTWGLALNGGAVTASLSNTMPANRFPGVSATLLDLRAADPVGATTFAALEGSGAAGQDDLIGGSSIAGQPSGDDIVYGDDADDAVYGDNAKITREIMAPNDARRGTAPYTTITGVAYARYDERYPFNAPMPAGATVVRKVVEHDVGASTATAPSGTFGDDFADGGKGNDSVNGQDGDDELWGGPAGESAAGWGDHVFGGLGDDELFGGGGGDVLIGDRGSVITQYLDATGDTRDPAAFTYKSRGAPFLTFDVFKAGSKVAPRERHWHRVDLYCGVTRAAGQSRPAFVGYGTNTATSCTAGGRGLTDDTKSLSFSGANYGGNDTARGGPGDDAIYGGAGKDLLNGDRGADKVFGGLGDDVLWGGMGLAGNATDPNNEAVDLVFGGAGDDFLDYKPRIKRGASGDGWNNASLRHDPDAWFEATAAYAHPDTPATPVESDPQHHQGVSWMYGGLGRDALQGSVTTTGPNQGTRMVDWNGLYNLYTQCGPDYGGYNIIRAMNASTTSFVQDLGYLSGAHSGRTSPTSGHSAADQLAIATAKDGQTGAPYTDAQIGGVPGTNYGEFIDCG
jgi:Ca2+-binding RTX toxin-like protein